MNNNDDRSEKSALSASYMKDLHRQALEALRKIEEQLPYNPESMSTEDIQQILHELRVHQIELNMQNEELRRIQAELQTARAHYFDLYDLAPIGSCSISENGRIVEANLTAGLMLGISRQELIHQPISRFICREDQDIYFRYSQQFFKQGSPTECELRMLKKDGTAFWVHLLSVAMQDTESNCLQRITLNDISERKLAAEKLRMADAFNRSLLESSLDPLIAIDHQCKITDVNSAAEQATGCMREELIGEDFYVYFTDPDKAKEGYYRVLELDIVRNYELEIKHKDGYVIPVLCNAALYKDEQGKPVGVLVAARDMTEHIRLENVVRAKEAAEFSSMTKTQFLVNMGHEIRTPLNGIMGSMQLLDAAGLTEEQKEILDISRSSADSLLAALNDILNYSKIEAGEMQLEKLDFSMQSMLNDTVSLFKLSAEKNGLLLEINMEETVPHYLKGDSFRLKQILSNLIGNAIKYTKAGRIDITVKRIETIDDGRAKLEFSVTDTGIGIPSDKSNVLFIPFSQVDNSNTRQYGGTGLGLSICKGLVEKMDGEIGFESTVGEGSRFHFTCIMDLGAAEDNRALISEEVLIAAPKQRTISILLVEDDVVARILVEKFARKKGWQITAAENGEDAVAIYQHMKFDIILMDVQMPVMNGYEATGLIRQMETAANRHTPIIAMTAHTLKENQKQCLEAGMDDFLEKPVNFNELERLCLEWVTKFREVNN